VEQKQNEVGRGLYAVPNTPRNAVEALVAGRLDIPEFQPNWNLIGFKSLRGKS
jgi:hypothetical protein